jgi:NAD+ kinase
VSAPAQGFLGGCAGIVANVSKAHATEATRSVLLALDHCGLSWKLELETARALSDGHVGMPLAELARVVTWLIVIGGDGTILQTARALVDHPLPLLGVNPGKSLGFMTDTRVQDVMATLDDMRAGRFTLLARGMLRAVVVGAGGIETLLPPALNDVVFIHGAHAQLIVLNVLVNGEFFTTYAADGLVLATATGSTAHAMSAGGPILFPDTTALVLTPICPHTLSNRPIILPRGYRVDVRMGEPHREVALAVDGQVAHQLAAHETIQVQMDTRVTQFIHSNRHSFGDVLREKLHWRGDLRVDRARE